MLRLRRRVLFGEPLRWPLPLWNLLVGCSCTLVGFLGLADLLPRGRQSPIVTLGVMYLVCLNGVLVLSVAAILQQVGS